MARTCDICSKKKQFGRQSRHKKGVAGKQWAKRAQATTKIFKPNLQWSTVEGVRLRLCTKCIKALKASKSQDIPAQTATS